MSNYKKNKKQKIKRIYYPKKIYKKVGNQIMETKKSLSPGRKVHIYDEEHSSSGLFYKIGKNKYIFSGICIG